MKAVLVDQSIDFPYTHDIGELLATLEQAGIRCEIASPEASRLTRYAVLTRYPGLADPITDEEYRTALELADEIVRWAESQIMR